jgi:hypothetical protein
VAQVRRPELDPDDFPTLFDEPPVYVRPDQRTASLEEQFEAFHQANPWVATALLRLAREGVARGRTRLGIGQLWEVLRWEADRVTGSPVKLHLNNNHRSRYARLLVRMDPGLDGVFETRELRS